jgi:RNA polymerase sigma factor (sigma-70 family)
MTVNTSQLLDHLRRLSIPAALASADDSALLARFAHEHDHDAFAALVAGHGPMVHNVCRRLLGNAHAAEDAFQAAFLVLARKAGGLRPGASVTAWLHGVAARVALNACRAGLRRSAYQQPLAGDEAFDDQPDLLSQLTAREMLTVLEEEVQRLPHAYRLPVALCCLEGLSQHEAAHRLGWTAGSVKGGLERGRARLRSRLAQRGLAPAAVLALLEAARGGLHAGLPAGLTVRTVKAALGFAGLQFPSPGAVPGKVVQLAENVLKGETMFKRKLAVVVACLLTMTALVAGTLGALSGQSGPGKEDADKNRQVQLTVDLHDGSRVIGTSATLKELLLRTSFGEVRIPIGLVESLQLKDDQGTAAVRFHNGDQLTGLLDLKALGDLKLTTALGETTVPLKLVTLCKIEPPPSQVKVTARASSTGEATEPNNPFQPGDKVSRWNSGGYAPAWIEADLGKSRKLESIVLVVCQLPAGETVHEIWVADEPMGEDHSKAKLVHTFRGQTDDRDVLKHTLGPNVSGRYVQILTVQSPSWVGWKSIDLQVR